VRHGSSSGLRRGTVPLKDPANRTYRTGTVGIGNKRNKQAKRAVSA
jgi:hypothetical protein